MLSALTREYGTVADRDADADADRDAFDELDDVDEAAKIIEIAESLREEAEQVEAGQSHGLTIRLRIS